MPTPRKGYFTKDGTKVPGTTTIIGRFKESGALIAWAYKRGKDGFELYDSRDKAAEVGTVIHDAIERYNKNEDWKIALASLTKKEDIAAAESGFFAFLDWLSTSRMEVIYQEMHLVSELHKYGGTPDAIMRGPDGKLSLGDWKSGRGVWADHLVQLGAYRILWNENHPNEPLTGGSHLCRFDKEHGDFAHHYYPNLDKEEEAFLLMRPLYDKMARIKKRA